MIEIDNVSKTFSSGARELCVLDQISFSMSAGQSAAIIGPSGSGKTTLLSLCGGLDRPSTGRIIINDTSLNELSEDELATFRNKQTGFVFQSFRLIPSLTALENVMVPAELRGDASARKRALQLLEQVGLDNRTTHYPGQLSGGEQQRVALARAFINRPRVIFADEPTGNLDEATGEHVLDILFALNHDEQTTLMLVTHDHALTERVERIITLKGGRLHQMDQRTP